MRKRLKKKWNKKHDKAVKELITIWIINVGFDTVRRCRSFKKKDTDGYPTGPRSLCNWSCGHCGIPIMVPENIIVIPQRKWCFECEARRKN